MILQVPLVFLQLLPQFLRSPANAGGKIDYRGVSLSSILGGIITDTIVYEMGNINKINDIVSFSPNGDSLMKPDELVLVGSKIIASDLGVIYFSWY